MRYGALLTALLLGGCSASLENMAAAPDPLVPIATRSCEGQSASQCKFINSPVRLGRKKYRFAESAFPFYRTRNELDFIDAEKGQWVAPAGTFTDGASIPPIFVPFIGHPRSRQFMNAATVHDAYCAESNKNGPYYHTAKWQKVHRMFYDGLVASGTSPIKAKIMYAAVYLGGPRWSEVRTPAPRRRAAVESGRRDARLAQTLVEQGLTITAVRGPAGAGGLRALQKDTPLTKLLPKEKLIAMFKQAKAHIQEKNPPVDDLEVYLTRLERDALGGASAPRVRPKPGRNFVPGIWDGDEGGDGGDAGNGGGNTGDSNSGGGHSGGSSTYGGGSESLSQ